MTKIELSQADWEEEYELGEHCAEADAADEDFEYMQKERNEVYDEIQSRTDKIISLRARAQDIANYATRECAFCSLISCLDCPMNIGEKEIVCISVMKIIR